MKKARIVDIIKLEERAKQADARAQLYRNRVDAERASLEAAIGGVVLSHLDDPLYQAAAVLTRASLNVPQQTVLDALLKLASEEGSAS